MDDGFQARLAAARERVAPAHVDRPPPPPGGPAQTPRKDRGPLLPVATNPRAHVNGDGTPKQRHPYREAAVRAVQRRLATPGYVPKAGYVLHVYPCQCGGWHVGNIKITDSEETGT